MTSLIYFELIFCIWYEVGAQFHSFACGSPAVPALFFEKTILSTINDLGTFVENQFTIDV